MKIISIFVVYAGPKFNYTTPRNISGARVDPYGHTRWRHPPVGIHYYIYLLKISEAGR